MATKRDKGYLTRYEAVKYSGVSLSTLVRLLRERRLRRYKRPGERCILISRAELDKALQPQEVTV